MLRHDDREERLLQRIGLALQRAEAVLEDVQVLRREGDEAALGQLGGEVVIGRVVARDDVLGTPFQAVLADDDRPPLARLKVLRHQQNAVGDHVGKDIEHHLVAGPRRRVVGLARAGIGGQTRLVERADHLRAKHLAIRPRDAW